jgi:hypothetical protein
VSASQISQVHHPCSIYIARLALCDDATLCLSRVARNEHPLVVVDARCCRLHPSRNLEAMLRAELIDIARTNGVNDSETLRRILTDEPAAFHSAVKV